MRIVSVGTSHPPYAMTLEDRHEVAESFVQGDEKDRWFVPHLFEKSTVQNRYSVLLKSPVGKLRDRQQFFSVVSEMQELGGPSTQARMEQFKEHATGLALESCRKAFEQTSLLPNQVTHLVTASCTGFSSPGVDIDLIQQLPLPARTQRTHLGFMGCHAGLNCLRVARAITLGDPQACVLVCATELCGLHYQYAGSNDQKVANALFADGSASAIVVGADLAENATGGAWRIAHTASMIVPQSYDLMTWKVSDHGFCMSLSEEIPQLIRQEVKGFLEDWLSGEGLRLDEIVSWCVHPGGPQILHAFARAMKLEREALWASYDVLRDYGNMSSATILFVLQKMMAAEVPRPCVALGFGPGITIEAALFR